MIIKTYIKYTFAIACIVSILACSSSSSSSDDDNGGGPDPTPEAKDPEAAKLVEPLKDEECNQGNNISDTESLVTFEWNKSENTDEYTLVIKNLLDDSTRNIKVTDTKKEETLLRGVPYSWHIISKSSTSTKTATSEKWKFYNAGIGIENYAPFPAELVSPAMGSLTKQTVALSWNGSDIDNDIDSYDVYLDKINPPKTLNTNNTASSTTDINLDANTVYYWMIVTKDKQGNNSNSQIFEFRTQE